MVSGQGVVAVCRLLLVDAAVGTPGMRFDRLDYEGLPCSVVAAGGVGTTTRIGGALPGCGALGAATAVCEPATVKAGTTRHGYLCSACTVAGRSQSARPA